MSEVFLSYRQTGDAHRKSARTFADRLRKCGISVVLDQLYLEENPGGPPEGWPKRCGDQAIKAARVLIIGTEEWFLCYDRKQLPGTGCGAACEAHILRQRIYDAGAINEDIRIVLFDEAQGPHISLDLKGFHNFQAERDFQAIVKWLGGILPTAAPDPIKPDWPIVAPLLSWPVADHTHPRSAFERLIVRSAAFRYLPVTGSSETGKSHITKQFLANAFSIEGLLCGRFDFKGSSDMDMELRTFAENLDVPQPTPNTGTSHQLGQIFTALRKSERPTLLIFDTFELAGEAARWMKDNLLLALPRCPWLRVIIVGQQVPQSHGEPWTAFSSPVVQLRLPTPEDWFEYGKTHKPDVTLEFVQLLHTYSGGKVTVLSQTLGPAA